MGLYSWLRSKLGMPDLQAEQARLLKEWEYAQINDWDLLEADPSKDELQAAARLIDDSPEEGQRRLQEFANNGSLYAMNYVAWCYAVGAGARKDWDQAEAWYRRAYEAGSDRALLEYGAYLHQRGRIDDAEKVYEAGWRRGFVPAVYRLIRIRLRSNLPMAERLAWQPSLEWAAAAGHPAARYLLSKYLCRGWFGVRGIPRGLRMVRSHIAGVVRGEQDLPSIV